MPFRDEWIGKSKHFIFIKCIILFKKLSIEQKLNNNNETDDTAILAQVYLAFCKCIDTFNA